LCGCNEQNAAASLFRVPNFPLATALNTEFSVLKKIAESISPDLTTLEKSSKAHCVPGKMILKIDVNLACCTQALKVHP
jgi:hypothetical protein